jgi:hypothetical protein
MAEKKKAKKQPAKKKATKKKVVRKKRSTKSAVSDDLGVGEGKGKVSPEKQGNLGGRPTTYSAEIAETICQRMAQGESLNAICKDEKMPARSTVMLWVAQDREGFSDRYEIAMQARAHYWADELLDIADDGKNDYMHREDPNNPGYALNGESIQRARLRVDSRKWLLSKLLPKYADKQQHEHTGKDGGAIVHEVRRTIVDAGHSDG